MLWVDEVGAWGRRVGSDEISGWWGVYGIWLLLKFYPERPAPAQGSDRARSGLAAAGSLAPQALHRKSLHIAPLEP